MANTANPSSLLASYPRVRPALPVAYQEVYEREYRLNREGERPVEGLAIDSRASAALGGHEHGGVGPAISGGCKSCRQQLQEG